MPDTRQSLFTYKKYKTHAVAGIGGEHLPIVFSYVSADNSDWIVEQSEFVCVASNIRIPIVSVENVQSANLSQQYVLRISEKDIHSLSQTIISEHCIVLFEYTGNVCAGAAHRLYQTLMSAAVMPPVLFSLTYSYEDIEMMQIASAMDIGGVFIDGFGDGICIQNSHLSAQEEIRISFGILQASRARFTKTEFISCPSCGRTLFNIEEALRRVQQKTAHLKGLKIAVMGCIVNGPGEMADADYGYVGAGRGKVHLYRKQQVVRKNIDEKDAVQALIDIIREYGDWHDEP